MPTGARRPRRSLAASAPGVVTLDPMNRLRAARCRPSRWLTGFGAAAFVAQSLLGPLFTLCVDADGSAHVEFAASGCCDSGTPGQGSHEERHHEASAVTPDPSPAEMTPSECCRHPERTAPDDTRPKGRDDNVRARATALASPDPAGPGPHCQSCRDIGLADVLRGVGVRSSATPSATAFTPPAFPPNCAPRLPAATRGRLRHAEAEPGGSGWPADFTVPMTR